MTAVLPVGFWILSFISALRAGRSADRFSNGRVSFLHASVVWGVFVTVSTEVLSLFNSLNRGGLVFVWLTGCVFAARRAWMTRPHASSSHAETAGVSVAPLTLLCIGGIFAVTGLLGLIAPPNTWDAMTYHMSRVVHWMQNESVAHYPSHIERQLFMSPWAEFAIVQFQILWQGDRLANLVQWFGFLGCGIGAHLIAGELGASRRWRITSTVLCVTLPTAILQATSTQTDGVTAFWLTCFVYFLLVENRSDGPMRMHSALRLGTCLGLAIFTKPTAYFIGFPFFIWLAARAFGRQKAAALKPLFVICLTTLLMNAGHLARNYNLYQSIAGPGSGSSEMGTFSEVRTPKSMVSNLVKNIAFNLATPSVSLNGRIESAALKLHNLISFDMYDPRATAGGYRQVVHPLSNHEDLAVNPVHTTIILLCSIVFFWKKSYRDATVLRYGTALLCAVFIFSLFFRWQRFGGRIQLPLFVLAVPLTARILSDLRMRTMRRMIELAVLAASVWWLGWNQTKPLFGPASVLRDPSSVRPYFLAWPSFERPYTEACTHLSKYGMTEIGLLLASDDWTYPLWAMLNRQAEKKVRFEQVGVIDNRSNELTKPFFDPHALVCTIGWKNKYPHVYAELEEHFGKPYETSKGMIAGGMYQQLMIFNLRERNSGR